MGMMQCAFCKSELPDGSRFCGRCGRAVEEMAQDSEGQSTALSDSGIEFLSTLGGPGDSGIEFLSTLGESGDSDIEFLPIIGGPAGPPQGNVPMVHGTPQVGGVPSVQGTPQIPSSFAGHGSSLTLPHHEHQYHQPFHHHASASPQPQPQHQVSQPQPQTFHHGYVQHQPAHSNQPTPQQPQFHHQASNQPQPQAPHYGHQHYQPVHQQLHYQVQQQQAASATAHQASEGARASGFSHTTKAQRGCRPSCLTTVVGSAVAIVGLVAALVLLPVLRGHSQSSPALILNGSIVPGGFLSIHGSNFTSGGMVTITIDGHQATIASADSPQASSVHSSASFLLGADNTTTAPSAGTAVSIRSDGTFDATIRTDPTWAVGSSHTLVATEQSSGQSAQLKVIVPQKPALTSCSKSTTITTLTLGPVDEGQKQAATAPFALCTTGSGMVNWSASWDQKQAQWLQLPRSGNIQAPLVQQFQVSASAVGLKAGMYLATVTFSSPDSSLKEILQVTLIVRSAQATTCINTNMQSLSFTATQGQSDPAPQTVTITDCGGPGSWISSVRSDDGTKWLTVGPTGGNLKSKATQDVSIKVSSANLGVGTYTGQVTFKIGQSMAVVNVTLTVQPPARNSCISANPGSLTFAATQGQGDPGSQTITIGNCGSSDSWSASTSTTDGGNWLSISPSNGTLNANATQNVSVVVSSANLQLGTYTGSVTFKIGSSTVIVNVIFVFQQQRQQPCLSVDSQSLAFTSTQGQGDPAAQTLMLTNCGPAGSWSAATANGSGWLSVTPGNDNLNAGASENVTVAVSTSKLSANTYNDQIIFTLGSSSVTVKVLLTVQPPPACIQANPTRLSLPDGSNMITLTNCGGTGTWSPSISTDNGGNWLGLHQKGGPLDSGTSTEVFTRLDDTGLNSGTTYTGHITFTITTSSGAQNTATVDVTYYIPPQPPCIQANTQSLTFSATQGQGDPAPQTVTISNCGDPGIWSASETTDSGSNWLSLSPASGSMNTGDHQDITFTVSSANLAPGTYTGNATFTINISSGEQSSVTVQVMLTIQPPPASPCINASTQSLTFSATQGQGDPPGQPVTISNCGDTGSWSASVSTSDGASWLGVSSTSGTLNNGASQDITFTVSSANLAPGTYTGQVTFTIQTSTVTASVTVNVTFTVSAPPVG